MPATGDELYFDVISSRTSHTATNIALFFLPRGALFHPIRDEKPRGSVIEGLESQDRLPFVLYEPETCPCTFHCNDCKLDVDRRFSLILPLNVKFGVTIFHYLSAHNESVFAKTLERQKMPHRTTNQFKESNHGTTPGLPSHIVSMVASF